MSLTSSDLELVYDGSNQRVGMRFTSVAVPRGATITRAYLQFEADETQSELTNLAIQGQAADNAAVFGSASGNISTRPRTVASVAWSPPAWGLVSEAGPNQRTPELATVVQEIVNRTGWASGNALALIITGSGHRTARAYEGKPTATPLLHIEYDNGPPQPPVNVAPVVSAGPDLVVTLPADAVLDATVSDDGLPSPPAALTTSWTVDSGPGPVTFQNAAAVDTRATFSFAGTYVLRLTASDSALGNSDTVQVTVQPAPPPGGVTFERRVVAGSDDAEESASGGMSLTSSDLELVYDGSNQRVGMRFTSVAVPRGATITRAYLQFEADETQSELTNLAIQGQAADNAAVFGSASGNISTRPRTVASVAWSPPAWGLVSEAGPNQRTPELATVVQEIVNRTGWASGNALALIITGTGHRTARAYEGKPTATPLLHIEYDNGPPQPPVNVAPVVSAGPDLVVTLPADAVLDATVQR